MQKQHVVFQHSRDNQLNLTELSTVTTIGRSRNESVPAVRSDRFYELDGSAQRKA